MPTRPGLFRVQRVVPDIGLDHLVCNQFTDRVSIKSGLSQPIESKFHMDNKNPYTISKRTVFIIVGLTDTVFGALVLLIYFGLLPVDISNWGIPRWIIGVIGGIWFMGALAFLVYQLTKTDVSE
jgi:hypothetical protein